MSAKEKTMKYGLVGLFLGILLLAHLDLLAENLSYFHRCFKNYQF